MGREKKIKITREQIEKFKEEFGPFADSALEALEEMYEDNQENIEKLRILKGDSYIEEAGIGKDPNTSYSVHFGGPLKDLSAEDLKFLKKLGVEAKFDQIHLKGLMLNQMGNYKDSVRLYDIALKLDSSDSKAWFGKANALSGLDSFIEAVDCYDKTIALEPNFSYAYSNKALALIELERFEETLPCIEKAIKLSPKYSNLWSDKAKALNCLKRFEEALIAAEKAIELDHENFRAWIEKGGSEMKLLKYSSGMESLDQALKIDPRNSYAIQLKKEIAVLRDIKKSDELIKKSPKDAESLKNKGLALLKIDKLEEALECFDKAVKNNPDLGEAWSRKGTILSQMGMKEKAMEFIDRSLEIEPNNSQFLERKALVLSELGRFQEAIEYCDKALKNESNCDIAKKLKSYCLMNIKQSPQFSHERISGKIIYFLSDNKGKAFTFRALNNRMEKILKDPSEAEYGRRNLQNILKVLTSKGSIKAAQHGDETHYFFQETSEIPSGSQQKEDDIFADIFAKHADVLTERDKDLLRDAFSGVDKKKKMND